MEQSLLVCLDDFELFRKTQVAPPCRVLVCCGSPPDRPTDNDEFILGLRTRPREGINRKEANLGRQQFKMISENIGGNDFDHVLTVERRFDAQHRQLKIQLKQLGQL